MAARVFPPSEVLKLVATSVTCDLEATRTQESTSASLLKERRETTVALRQPTVRDLIFITSLSADEPQKQRRDAGRGREFTRWTWILVACRLTAGDPRWARLSWAKLSSAEVNWAHLRTSSLQELDWASG